MDFPMDNMASWRGWSGWDRQQSSSKSNTPLTYEEELEADRRKAAKERQEANAKDALNDTMDSVNDVVKNVSKKMDKTKCKSDEDCPEGKCKNGECSDKKSGFKNNVPPSSPSTVNGDSDDAVGERIDYAATMEQAYDNLQNMLGKDGMKSITNETKKLVTQQKDLIGTLNSMTPILNNAKETLANLDLGDMGDVSEMIKKFTNTKKK